MIQIKLTLTPELVRAIQQTPEYALKPSLVKAVRLMVEKHVVSEHSLSLKPAPLACQEEIVTTNIT